MGKKNRGKRPKWTPFEEQDAGHWRRLYESRLGVAEANRLPDLIPDRVFENSRYIVFWYDVPGVDSPTRPDAEHWPAMIHLSIKEHNRSAIRDWRDFQRIKNELVGPEHEALELYPAEKRLVDTANQFHLYVLASDKIQLPFGMTGGRAVVDSDGKPDWQGSRQRKLEDPPPDAITREDFERIAQDHRDGKPPSSETIARLAARHASREEPQTAGKAPAPTPEGEIAALLGTGELKLEPYQKRIAKLFEDKTAGVTLKQRRQSHRAQLHAYAKLWAVPNCGFCHGGGIIQQQQIADDPIEEFCECLLETR